MNRNISKLAVIVISALITFQQRINAQEDNNASANSFDGKAAYSQIFKENVAAAVAEHPRSEAARAARDEKRYQEDEARAALYPQIGVDLNGRQRIVRSFENRFDNITQRSLRDTAANISLVGRQLLYDGGSTSSKIASARYAFSAADEKYSFESSSVALAAVEAHYYVLYERTRSKYHRENVARHNEILEMVNERFKSGRGPNRDVTLMMSRLASAETSALRAKMDLDEATSHYEEIYNFSPENIKHPEIGFNLPRDEIEALEIGFQNNRLLTAATSTSLSSKENMKAIRSGQLPSLSLELAATKYDLERGNRDYDVSGRLLLNYSLYNGGARSARISQSAKSYEGARKNEENISREVTRGIKVAFQMLQSQVRQIISLEKAMTASRINRDQTREQFEVTGGSLFNLLEAEKEYHSSREQYLGGSVEQALAEYRLLNVIGTLLPALNIVLRKESE